MSVKLTPRFTELIYRVHLDVEGAGLIQAGYSNRLFRPVVLAIRYTTERTYVNLAGPVPKKDGTDSLNRGRLETNSKWVDSWAKLPEWVRQAVEQHRPVWSK